MSPPVTFICGATGTQGGSLARYLCAKNLQVHALARNPTSTSAKALDSLGVKLWPGDFDNLEALNSAMEGCTSIFLNLSPDFQDHAAEGRWASNIITAGKNAGVKHIVYSSGFAVSEPQRLKHWDPQSFVAMVLLSKQAIEKQSREAGFQYWTILRPGNFMANYLDPLVRMYPGLVSEGVWSTALRPDNALPTVDTATVAAFSGAAILDPERFHGKEIEYADELLYVEQIVEKLSKATGRDLRANFLSEEEVEKQKGGNPFIAGQLMARDMAQFVDMEEVKQWGIPLSNFDVFLEREKKRVDETYLKSA